MKKRILAFVLAFLMVVGLIPTASVYASDVNGVTTDNNVETEEEESFLIGFLNKEQENITFYNNLDESKTFSLTDFPDYLILKVSNKMLGEKELYEADYPEEAFYLNYLSGNPYVEAGYFSEIVSPKGLYVTLVKDRTITLYKELTSATDVKTAEASELAGEYVIEEVCYEETLYNWFVKLTPDANWPSGKEDYVWISYYDLLSVSKTPAQGPGESVKCEICGETDCNKVHFFCSTCEKYDCGVQHIFCPACGEGDCEKEHVYCGICGEYDCGKDHQDYVDEFVPPVAPVIPENPELTEGAEVSIVNEYGEALTDGLSLMEGTKSSISAWSKAGENVSYQWQVCYNNANQHWVDIWGATEKGLLVSPAMFLNIIDYYGETYVRCVTTTAGGETQISEALPVTVEEAVPQQSVMLYTTRSAFSENALMTAAEEIEQKYSIIIEFKFTNGDTAAQPWTANLAAGQDYVLDVECPTVVGYKPDKERITETITNISGNKTYTVLYEPDYVDYKVIHHQQNIGDNNYTAVKTETKTGLTGTPVGTGLEEHYDGFYSLVYDPEITVAADGSTIINIYYDRYYYLVSLDLNGGYGVEPIYARYGTPINTASWIPERTGYAFGGWSPTLPASVGIGGSSHKAQWTKAETGFTVAFWYENANDEEYTFVGSSQQTAVTGTKVNGASYKNASFDGRDDAHFTYEKADTNVEIAADGSTVVNVYFTRNSYTLTYLKWRCVHTHGSGCTYCSEGKVNHKHSHSECCKSNWIPEAIHACQYKGCKYGYEHTHGASCCTHKAVYGCPCTYTDAGWYVSYSGTFKYEQDVSTVHAAQGAERWCPKTGSGFTNEGIYGGGLAVGTFSSMKGNDVTFYQGNAGTVQYYLTYWLETYDGSGSRTYNGRNFAQGTTFTPKMGAVGYQGDYLAGCPSGFEAFEAWASNSKGGDNVAQLVAPNGSFSGDTYVYFNFYYVRKTFTLTYFNGSNQVATRTMKYDEPLTSSYNLQNLTMTSPYGSGYYFAGWYLDADCTVPVSWGSTRMPDGGMAVYAKWTPLTHTINTYQTEGGTRLGTYITTHGTAVSNPPEDPKRDGYDFVSWFYKDDGVEKAYNFSMPVNRDLELYAVWTSDSLASGTISYMIEGTNTKIAEDTPISGLVGASKTYAAKTGTELNSGYLTGYFPKYSSHNIEFSSTTSQNNWIFYYTKMDDVKYTVRYVNKDTGADLMAATTGTSNAGKVTVTHKTYAGYAADAYSKDLILSSDPELNVVIFYYTKDDEHAPVQIEHYIQNTTGTGYILYFSEQPYNGVIGEPQQATPLSMTGFTYNSGKSSNNVTLTASGLVLKLYYDRNTYPYAFHFVEQVTNNKLQNSVTGSGLYGAQISQIAPAIPGYDLESSGSLTITIGTDSTANERTFYYEEASVTIRYQVGAIKGGTVSRDSETIGAVSGSPTGSTASASADYGFTGWYTDYACTKNVSSEAAFVPSKTDGVYVTDTYYAGFAENKVTIHYAIAGPDGSASLSTGSEQVSVLSGKAGGSTVTVAEKYEFAGWFDKSNNKVGDSITLIPKKTGEKWVDGTTYYAKVVEKKATIQYKAVGYGKVAVIGNEDAVSEKVDMVTGKAIGATATPIDKISTFVGWYSDIECTQRVSNEALFIPDTPTGGWNETTIYYAKFEGIKYTISFDTGVGEPEPKSLDPVEYAYGESLELPEVTNGVYKVTWTVKEIATDSDGWEVNSTVKDGDIIEAYGNVTLLANWTVNVVWVDYDFDISNPAQEKILDIEEGASYVEAGQMHTYSGETPTRESDARYTYEFSGWKLLDIGDLGKENNLIVYQAQYTSELAVADLTISVSGEEDSQSYIFTITGQPDDGSSQVSLKVVLVGTQSKTIKDLPMGSYTIEETTTDAVWSWRQWSLAAQTIDLKEVQEVKFEFGDIENNHWLSGLSYGIWKGGSN